MCLTGPAGDVTPAFEARPGKNGPMDGVEEADPGGRSQPERPILTPDQRVRVFVSSTLEELAAERAAVREAVDRLHLAPVLFELAARAHPPRSLYRSYLEQSHIFVGIYWQRYGWVAPTMDVSGLEDEYLLAGAKPKLMYVKRPAPGARRSGWMACSTGSAPTTTSPTRASSMPPSSRTLVAADLALLLSEAFLFEVGPGADAPSTRRFTLPGDATAFLGRGPSSRSFGSLIEREDIQLVTLTGPGGIGKTRLALRAAAEAAPAFEEGAAFVSLGSLQDAEQVPAAIAAAVGLREAAASRPTRSGPTSPIARCFWSSTTSST